MLCIDLQILVAITRLLYVIYVYYLTDSFVFYYVLCLLGLFYELIGKQ